MEIQRKTYLDRLISYQWDGQIKVITGIRRCGKSFLLQVLFKRYLLEQGVREENILSFELDLLKDMRYRDPIQLATTVRERVSASSERYYLFIDEIQMAESVPNPYIKGGKAITFYDALNDLRSLPNLDIYVTGSNSKMLSTDILTEFRGRSDEIRIHPLSFSEVYAAVRGDKLQVFEDYAFFGGLPLCLSQPDEAAKMRYLQNLISEVYLKDIIERRKIEHPEILTKVLNLLCSSVGSLTNPKRIADALTSLCGKDGRVSQNTIRNYISALEDAFLFSKSLRYDMKGKSYLSHPQKYYCEDIGLRNVQLGFRQQEMPHIMENIIYNELVLRGFMVDIGIAYDYHNGSKTAREIDFIANLGNRRFYIQSAYALPTEEKRQTELRPFMLARDASAKILIRHDIQKPWYDENGILHLSLIDFLLDSSHLSIR